MSDKKSDLKPWLTQLRDEENPLAAIDDKESLPSDTIGLAFSGGGIRSASFCLGVLQSLTEHGWLPYIDYLSTVSGGGYIGTYLGRFFDQCRAPDGVAGPLPNHAPGAAQRRVASELGDSRSASISWLRHNANYLAPTGFGEAMFNFAAFWRNFLSMHFVLGVFFLGLFGLANALSYCPHFPMIFSFGELCAEGLAPIGRSLLKDNVTLWLALGEVTLWLAVLPLAVAYWLVSQDYHERFVFTAFVAMLVLAVTVTVGLNQPLALFVFAAAISWVIFTWHCIRKTEGHSNPRSQFRLALARNQLTYLQSFWTAVLLCILALGVIDFAGRYLAHTFLFEGGHRVATQLVAIGTSLIALAPMLRGLSMLAAAGNPGSDSWLMTLLKIPYLSTILMLLIGAVLPLTLLSWTSHVSYGLGSSYEAGLGATVVVVLISCLLGSQEALPFVNRSGPLTIYAARLARVFMGAVNPVRLRHKDGDSVTAVIEGDDVPMTQYAPHAAGGPLHLINVAVNETVDVASERGMRDRQAENMAIGPAGINVARNWHSFWSMKSDNRSRTVQLQPLGNSNESHPFLTDDGRLAETESLNVRQWMAISGAAISPGLGRLTSASLSLLFTLSNLRLGYWWDSGIWSRKRLSVPIQQGIFESIANVFKRVFATQSLLVAELRGQFSGPWRRYFYLSDGGNFENTAAYELLRRRVPLIVMCDAGRDHLHQATGIADLTRIVRIDFGAEIEALSDDLKELETTLRKIGVPERVIAHLGTLDDLLGEENRLPHKHALLLRVRYPRAAAEPDPWNGRNVSWILYLKLTMTGDESADIRNYKMTHKDFPNESTLDQFFDEPQWESYRKLGEHIGNKLFR